MNSNGTVIAVLVIFGPTACGKTALLNKLFACKDAPFFARAEVISADSMQVYKGLNIGTAKPPPAILETLPHHLIDVVLPREQFTAGDFVREADALCQKIFARGKLPVIAGGTGFYIRNFLLGLPATPQGGSETRKKLKERAKAEGTRALHAELALVDPLSAKKIHVNDEYRIVRALEVYLDSGKPLSDFALPLSLRTHSERAFDCGAVSYNFCTLCMTRPRTQLYERIDERVENMFEAGLEDEVSRLMLEGYSARDPGMRAIGYGEFFADEVVSASGEQKTQLVKELVKRNTKRYAKRQMTYMKGIPQARFVVADDFLAFESIARAALQA